MQKFNKLFIVFVLILFLSLQAHGFFSSSITETKNRSTSDILLTKLQKTKNDFKLKSSKNLIPQAMASSAYEQAKAYVVIDSDTGNIINSKNLSEKMPIASLTKIMTGVIALDLESPDETFEITNKAAKTIPTKIGVIPGQKMKLYELISAALMTSANDAAEEIKDGIDLKYGKDTFVNAMNKKAELIGLKNTHFANPQGFDSNMNYSSPEDLAILAHYATIYPLIREIAAQDYKFLPQDKNHKQFDFYNWNGLLGVYPGISGLKIGNTDDAGYTTVVIAERSGRKFIAVLLGAPGVRERDLWTATLLDDAFEKEANLPPVRLTADQLDAKYKTWKYWN